MSCERNMDTITTEMMVHLCDKLCRYPHEVEDEDELKDICCECRMGEFVNGILNEHNKMTANE